MCPRPTPETLHVGRQHGGGGVGQTAVRGGFVLIFASAQASIEQRLELPLRIFIGIEAFCDIALSVGCNVPRPYLEHN